MLIQSSPYVFVLSIWILSSNISLRREIVLKIINLQQQGASKPFKWVPSHDGIPQNELADRLAGAAGQLCEDNAPQVNQPPLPCTVSFSLAKAAMKKQLQERWLRLSMGRKGRDHLSHVQLGHGVVSRFFEGGRYAQTTLARFRFGHSAQCSHVSHR